jgi:hypothetical protein
MVCCLRSVWKACFLIVLSGVALAATVGSPNTVTADPLVARPGTTPCVVQLFQNVAFADFSAKPFSYAAPSACPGPWAKVVFSADFSVTAGRQFDRTANIWLGGANIYFGTTAEPGRVVSPQWHIERDLTDYSALLTTATAGEADLGNVVNSTYTGIVYGSAQLEFYPADKTNRAPKTPDVVLPLAGGANGETVALFTTADLLTQTFSLPANIERAYLDVYSQSQSSDEFWYSCVPDDVAGPLQSCPGTGFRESEVSIDGVGAGVAPVYPWIYTGGIDPYLWRPIPGVQTLKFVPYRVDLTPFAGVLSDGQPHEVAVSVFNADSYFSATASLLLFLDHGASSVTGAVTENTLGSAPSPVVKENIQTDASGNITGTVAVTSARHFKITGYVNTSHGRVATTVAQDIQFANRQKFDITASLYLQEIAQNTKINSTTTVSGGEDARSHAESLAWPATVKINFSVYPNGNSTQYTAIQQGYQASSVATGGDDDGGLVSSVSNSVKTADTLRFDASGNFLGNKGQKSSQSYFSQDSRGGCYSESLTAVNDLLASVTDGVGCK